MELTPMRQFETERMGREIDSCQSIDQLRSLTRQLLQAWQAQRAATEHMARQALAADHQQAMSAVRAQLGQRTAAVDCGVL